MGVAYTGGDDSSNIIPTCFAALGFFRECFFLYVYTVQCTSSTPAPNGSQRSVHMSNNQILHFFFKNN